MTYIRLDAQNLQTLLQVSAYEKKNLDTLILQNTVILLALKMQTYTLFLSKTIYHLILLVLT